LDTLKLTPLQTFLVRFAAARMLVLFAFHAIVFAGCYGLAYLIRFDFSVPPEYIERLRTTAPMVIGGQLLVGAVFGFYRGWWRYVGVGDVIRLVFGMTTSMALLLGAWYAAPSLDFLPLSLVRAPRGVLLIDWSFAIIMLLGTRVVIRLGRDRFRPAQPHGTARRVAIIGAGDAGESLAREIEHRPQIGMKVVAFVDDQRAKWKSMIRGITVTGPISNIAALAEDLQIDEVLIAIPSASGKRLREIIHHLSAADLPFKTIPGIDHLVTGRVHVSQLRPVNVEDLLRRARIDLPGDPVRELFRGKRVMVTGAGGTIGSELALQIAGFEPESLALVERSEYALYEIRKRLAAAEGAGGARITSNLVDICDYDVMESLLEREQPHIVLHAAAHKHVPIGEENPHEYLRNNCLATRRVAELCEAAGVSRFVLISTDKAINPSSVMGASKRAAEIALLDIIRNGRMKGTVVRFGNVIGSSGSVIPLFMEQIAAGGPITVTDPEVTRYFIRTSEAVSLVLQAATLGDAGDIFMLDMGEPVKVVDLARDLIRLSNHSEEEIPIVFTGLRPGEKMFEEIRLEGESIRPTVHPQIVVTEAPQPDRQKVARWLTAAAMNATSDPEVTVALVLDLVPEYVPTGRPETRQAARDTEVALPLPTLDGGRAWV
jgi:FlaA1/EpsC-like NDP-sugar epimerase